MLPRPPRAPASFVQPTSAKKARFPRVRDGKRTETSPGGQRGKQSRIASLYLSIQGNAFSIETIKEASRLLAFAINARGPSRSRVKINAR